MRLCTFLFFQITPCLYESFQPLGEHLFILYLTGSGCALLRQQLVHVVCRIKGALNAQWQCKGPMTLNYSNGMNKPGSMKILIPHAKEITRTGRRWKHRPKHTAPVVNFQSATDQLLLGLLVNGCHLRGKLPRRLQLIANRSAIDGDWSIAFFVNCLVKNSFQRFLGT